MHNNLSEQQKKQAALYICSALSITVKRKFEIELKTNSELKDYVKQLQSTVEITRQISTLKPADEFLQGSRNLLQNQIHGLGNKKNFDSTIATVVNKIKNGTMAIVKTRQPIWAVATYIVIGLIAGRLLLAPNSDKPVDISGQANVNMDKLIQSGILMDVQIDQSTLSPSSIKMVSSSDERFNVSGNVNDQNIRKILYYLLLNDEDTENRFQAGELVRRITPNNESQMVLISSILSEKDPRVKLQSMETLSDYEPSPELINACKRILLDDHNAEMRLEALNILTKNKSTDLIPLLKVVSNMDDNSTVRDRAKKLLEELQQPVSIENSEVTK